MTRRGVRSAVAGAALLAACGPAPTVDGISEHPRAVRAAAPAPVSGGGPTPATGTSTVAPRQRAAPRTPPVFRASVSGPLTRADVPYSWRPGCPVPPSGLRRLTVTFWGFDGRVRTGALVVSASSVAAVRSMMQAAFTARFRFRSVVPIDAFYRGGRVSPETSDLLSMNADNTSAFNCRPKTGRSSYSEHSWGAAIDINPYENPARAGSRIYPAAAASRYVVNRRAHLRDPGVITSSGALYRAAVRAGWHWGGWWSPSTDYQHFSRSGR